MSYREQEMESPKKTHTTLMERCQALIFEHAQLFSALGALAFFGCVLLVSPPTALIGATILAGFAACWCFGWGFAESGEFPGSRKQGKVAFVKAGGLSLLTGVLVLLTTYFVGP